MHEFLKQQTSETVISQFCSSNNIEWRFIPERSSHFGGIWESAVKSAKTHLRRVIHDTKLTFEEATTVLAQVEACLNSRPLTPVDSPDNDGIEVLTPGHFLVGQPLCALPDPPASYQSGSLLRRWHLCQSLVRHFWRRWSTEYISTLNRYTKWHHKSRNLCIGDVVILKDEAMIPTKWPLGRVIQTHPGKDDLVRVATVKTARGVFKRPVTKLTVHRRMRL